MGLLNVTAQAYYQGSNHGNYQFTSLKDIINHFLIAYVGEDKVLNNIRRADVMFHAKRGMQELSFDTFKSHKAQEVVLPPSLSMILPQDYVNYTRVMWSDGAGIKHPIYPTKHTQNPFSVCQDDEGNYIFNPEQPVLEDPDFSNNGQIQPPWFKNAIGGNTVGPSNYYPTGTNTNRVDSVLITGGKLRFKHWQNDNYPGIPARSRVYAVWQAVDVTNMNFLEVSAQGGSAIGNAVGGALEHTYGIVRIGISTTPGYANSVAVDPTGNGGQVANVDYGFGDLGYLEWNGLSDNNDIYDTTQSPPALGQVKTLTLAGGDAVNVQGLNTVYVVITSWVDYHTANTDGDTADAVQNYMDNIIITSTDTPGELQTCSPGSSTTWQNYQSNTPSENAVDDYEDDTYWPANGERYGLEPEHAQVNGSFYIDDRTGSIHFSSNLAGKTIVLDYISDGLATDEEMVVPKLAEEAMYKWIMYGVLSSKVGIPEYQIARAKKEKFAEIRKAKLRLSNIKLEQITQILRGKSKHIKH
jgi:hypothetical protein